VVRLELAFLKECTMAINYEAKLPKTVPDSANVYQCPAPTVSNAVLTTLAKNIGLTGAGKDFLTSADTLSYLEGRFSFEIRRVSGAISFRHEDKYGIEADDQKEFALTDRRCDRIGRKLLQSARLFPMASAKLAKVTHLHAAEANREDRKVIEKILDAGVIYSRTIDDLPVIGPGGFAIVNIGPDADVVGMRSIWRKAGKRAAKVKIKPPAAAIEAFEKLAARFKGDTTVVRTQFGYFEHGPLDRQTIFEPAYALIYVVRYDDVAHKAVFVMHAGDKTFGKLIGPKRFVKGDQRARSKR